jgi:hypothetical protein
VAVIVTGKNRIMIYGPKDDGTYVIAFMTAEVTDTPGPTIGRTQKEWMVAIESRGRFLR